ncbi:hypothetical protein C0992_004744, partial [Termitomyces sp. T32_za158]
AYALGKLYSNTLLAVFNNRIYMSSKGMFPRSRTLSTTVNGIEVKSGQRPSSGQTTEKRRESQVESRRIKVFCETKITKEGLFETLGVCFP